MQVHQYTDIPEIEEIGDNIFRTSIPQPFYANNNIYILNSDEPLMIDSGYLRSLGLLQRSLKRIGLSLKKIKHVIYTHDHIDHISGALSLRYYTDARLYGMRGMAGTLNDYATNLKMMQRSEERLIYKAHADPEIRKKHLGRTDKLWGDFFVAYDDYVENNKKTDRSITMDTEFIQGDVLRVGGREIGFLHTPGHNRWHLTPYIIGEGIYFTGDLILDNVSAIYAEEDGNLQDYHNSLDRLSRLPIKRLLPAHGDEPADPQRKIRVLQKTISLLERGVIRRLKEEPNDLRGLATAAMGEKITESGFYYVGLGVIHAIVQKLQHQGQVTVEEVDPPYERYHWVD